MESHVKIRATAPQMREFFERDGGVRYYELKDKRYSEKALDNMPDDEYNSKILTFAVIYRHAELEKHLSGTFTIDRLLQTVKAMKKEQ